MYSLALNVWAWLNCLRILMLNRGQIYILLMWSFIQCKISNIKISSFSVQCVFIARKFAHVSYVSHWPHLSILILSCFQGWKLTVFYIAKMFRIYKFMTFIRDSSDSYIRFYVYFWLQCGRVQAQAILKTWNSPVPVGSARSLSFTSPH